MIGRDFLIYSFGVVAGVLAVSCDAVWEAALVGIVMWGLVTCIDDGRKAE